MQRRRVPVAAVRPYDDLDIMIERHQEPQQALHRKLPEFAAQHFGNVRLRDAEQLAGLDLFQLPILEDGVDFVDELRLDQMLLGVRQAEVFEDIAAAGFILLLSHYSVPFAICSASRSRCSINSMSRRGVARPVFDFFWNTCST